MNAVTLEYIRLHAKDDVRQLALRPVPTDVDLRAALTQIEGRQLATHKLPTWAATDGLLYPPRLSLEQCSSEATAAYKRQVVESLLSLVPLHAGEKIPISTALTTTGGAGRGVFLDLTGGLGVDFAALAPLFGRAIYVEQQQQLCELAQHNFRLLGLPHAEVCCSTAEEALQALRDYNAQDACLSTSNAQRSTLNVKRSTLNDQQSALNDQRSTFNEQPDLGRLALLERPSLIFLDPARRDAAGRKVSRIEDCTPDVCAMQEQLRAAADFILIKLSPMLDLTAALNALQGITAVHVVSVSGECKELLMLMRGNTTEQPESPCTIHCMDLPATLNAHVSPQPSNPHDTPLTAFTFNRAEEAVAPLCLAPTLSTYLYEPNASILKAGAFKTICQHFPVHKLAPQAHLYTAQQLITDFPGRIWRIVDRATFAKKDLRRMLTGITAAELSTRGFPISVAALRQQLHLHERGQTHLIATTLGQQRLLLKVEKASPPTLASPPTPLQKARE